MAAAVRFHPPEKIGKSEKIGDRLLFPRFTGLVGRRISAVKFVKE